ncbi:hypothetical protein EYF80_048365 [Liparis tanakae]|uniref:Uncharacterized protein n=1 Tax=Liparis tanakae TaxID=230148 RepID=A0A4Z2FJY3_9TELE|nr:hypothetical protein EYF80_048365 [Liparis tanakae]
MSWRVGPVIPPPPRPAMSHRVSPRSTCTFLVKLPEEEPTMARLVTRPLNTDWTELMKLDFPEPTGPRRRTRARGTSALLGL